MSMTRPCWRSWSMGWSAWRRRYPSCSPSTRVPASASTRRASSSGTTAACRCARGRRVLEPLGYLELLSVVAGASLVVTDSGGLQEETSFLGVPCLTVRPSTERPITCTHGTNRLVLAKRDAILAAAERALARRSPARPVIERWDGRAAERIARVVCDDERFELDAPLAATSSHPPRRAVAIPQPLGAG